jgi:hypothetical protein
MPPQSRQLHTLNFTCTVCGRCCHGSFAVRVDEALRLATTVPLTLGIAFTAGPSKNPSPPQAQAERRYIIRYITGGNRVIWLFTTISTLNHPDQRCAFLKEDNLCGLHGEQKPLRCRTMPLFPGTDPTKGVMETTTQKCPPEALSGPPLVRSGRVVNPNYAALAHAELAAMERDLETVGKAILFASTVLPDVQAIIDNPRLQSDLFAVSPAFLALAACGQGLWTYAQGAAFCEVQTELLDDAGSGMFKDDPVLSPRIKGFAETARVIGRDLRQGGGLAMQDWKKFN